MSQQKNYVPIPFEKTDDRLFTLKYNDSGIIRPISEEFTQLDLLQIMKHLRKRNDRLYRKFKDIILDVDYVERTRTDFKRELPQRRFNGRDS